MRGGRLVKIGEVCSINAHSTIPDELDKIYIYIDIDAVESGTGKFSLDKRILSQNLPSRARRLAKANSTLISTVRPNLKSFAYIENEIENSIFSTGFAILNSKNTDILLDKMIYFTFMYSKNIMQQMEEAMPKGQYPSINKTDIENFTLLLPPLAAQTQIIDQIQALETKIKDAQAVMDKTAEHKKAVLDSYLN